MENKTFSMIELFSGIGAQERALRQLKIPYRIVNTCACDKDAVLSYAAMRFDIDNAMKTYQFPAQDKMINELQNKGVGYDFMKSKHTITSRTPINKLQQYYIADKLSNNLGDISKVEKLPYADMVTYSSPCQSFSVAGKLAGAKKICKACGHEWEIDFSNPNYNYKCPHCGSAILESTTSGLLQEVQRLLSVAYENNELPKYLLLENVKNLVGKKFKPQFDAWIRWLDSIGYNTYYQVLNSKHYGIPQNRERVFALSIRKDVDSGEFKFPEQIPLTTRLKDILEKNVDEKYYLSGDKVESVLANFIARQNEASGINLKDQTTAVVEPFIVTSRGRNPENSSDRTTGSPTEQRLEANTNGTTNTITTVAKDNYVMEPVVCEQRCDEGLRFFKDDVVGTLRTIDACGDKRVIEPELTQIGTIDGNGHEIRRRVYNADGISPTLCGVCSGGNTEPKVLVKDEDVNPVRIGNIYGEQFGTGYAGNVWDQNSVSPTIMTAQGGNRQPLVVDNVKWRIRKLTPKECWRLMSFSDDDCNRASKYVSDSALYKQAGNSIVTSCLVAIFYSLLFNDSSTKWSDYIVQYKINGGNYEI